MPQDPCICCSVFFSLYLYSLSSVSLCLCLNDTCSVRPPLTILFTTVFPLCQSPMFLIFPSLFYFFSQYLPSSDILYFILKTFLLDQNVSSYKNIIIHYWVFSAPNSGHSKSLLNDECIRFMLISIIIECQRSRDCLPSSFSESQHFFLALTSCCILMVYPLKL